MKPGSLAAKPGQKGVKDPGLWIRWVEGNPGDPGSNPGRATTLTHFYTRKVMFSSIIQGKAYVSWMRIEVLWENAVLHGLGQVYG